jgi:hypothetical protein
MDNDNTNVDENLNSYFVVTKELKKIVKSQTEDYYSKPKVLSDILQKSLGSKYNYEISLIVKSINANIIGRLSYTYNRSKLDESIVDLTSIISMQYGYSKTKAKWAVYSWAFAFATTTTRA